MKTLINIKLITTSLIIVSLSLSINLLGQNIAINTTGDTPNNSAMLDIKSTNQGILIPRITDDQRKLLKDPVPGLLIYNTTSGRFNFYNDKGWQQILKRTVSNSTSTGTGPGLGTAINLTGDSPHPSAILDVSSTEKGFLLPRTTRESITTPVRGLIIYNINTHNINYYNGSSWQRIFFRFIDNDTGDGATTGGVSINSSGDPVDNSAMLEVKSTTKGLLIPRLTSVQRNAIKSPALSLTIYNTTRNKIESWIGSAWQEWDLANEAISTTGKTWMDRNLGASQVATSINDALAYGDLYQWGRFSDGHEKRASSTIATLSNTDTPGHAQFITTSAAPDDWRTPQNDNLWQGVNGINNPCPYGYRIPTATEWEEERASWSSSNSAGALNSPLKLPTAGHKAPDSYLDPGGTYSDYWSSTINGTLAQALHINNDGLGASQLLNFQRVRGFSVRCIKDE